MVMSFNICWFIVNFFFTDLFFMFLNGIFLCFTTIACIVFLGFEEFYFASRNISSFFEISVKKLQKKLNNERFSFKNRKFSSDPVYLGVGYEFKPQHSRELHSLLDLGLSGSNGPNQGSFQIHNLGKSKDIYTHVKDLEGHTLIFGTPGSGKTRFFDLLISQAIYRNDVDKAIYSSLRNIGFFMKAKASCGTVIWDDDIDIAPEHLYECSQPA